MPAKNEGELISKEPWKNEPDELHGEFCGIEWRIKRNAEMGNLCGYAKLPLSHDLYDVHYDNPKVVNIEVHGGLTYSQVDSTDNRMEYGFDCAHFMDLVPGMAKILPNYLENHSDDTYRDIDYVKNECQKLCWQLAGNTFTSKLNEALFEKYKNDE